MKKGLENFLIKDKISIILKFRQGDLSKVCEISSIEKMFCYFACDSCSFKKNLVTFSTGSF